MTPSHKPSKSRTEGFPWTLAAGVAILLAAAAGLTFWWVQAQDDDTVMRVEVHLDNRCELVDESFMAVVEPGGQKAYFKQGVAVLQAAPGSRIRVRGSDRYPDFSFPGSTAPAAPKVVITTQCGDKIDRVMDAMREQFQKKAR